MKTISLDLAIRIRDKAKEKGIQLPESEYVIEYYKEIPAENVIARKFSMVLDHQRFANSKYKYIEVIDAYTSDELWEILPAGIAGDYHLTIDKYSSTNSIEAYYGNTSEPRVKGLCSKNSLCETLGEEFLFVLSNDYL